jgi:hypothetical protein
MMLLAQLPTKIPELMFQMKPNAWGSAIGQGLSGSVAMGQRGYSAGKSGFNAIEKRITQSGSQQNQNITSRPGGVSPITQVQSGNTSPVVTDESNAI